MGEMFVERDQVRDVNVAIVSFRKDVLSDLVTNCYQRPVTARSGRRHTDK